MEPAIQTIVRKYSFDAAHRIVNHSGACGNVHGHLYFGELKFSYTPDKMEDPALGYSMDFSEIKRIGIEFINEYFDHGYICNSEDYMLPILKQNNSKYWEMSLNGEGKFCNPSVENMAKELFLAIDLLFDGRGIQLDEVIMYETPNSYTICQMQSISLNELENFNSVRYDDIKKYALAKGIKSYDKNKNGLQ